MTTVALLFHDNLKKILNKLLHGYIQFLNDIDKASSRFFYGKEFIVNQYNFDVQSKIISNQIWITEKIFGRDHIIISLTNQSDDILNKMASLAIAKLTHKKILFFSGGISFDTQLEDFFKILSKEDTFIYCIIFGITEPNEYEDIKNLIQDYFFKASIKVKEFFNLEDASSCLKKIRYRKLERSPASDIHKELLEKRIVKFQEAISAKDSEIKDKLDELIKPDNFINFQIDYLFSSIINFILEDSYYEGGTWTVELDDEDTHICTFPDGSIVEIDQYNNIHLHREEKGMWNFLGTISSLLDNRDLIHWINKLPTHLATILWLIFVNIDIKLKCKHLINFFDGFTQYNTTIMLSSFYLDNYFKYSEWIDKREEFKGWYKKPTFGSWFEYYKRSAKIIRTLLNSKNSRTEYLELSKISEEFWKIITRKEIIPLLKGALEIRNQIAHKGELPNSFYKESLNILELNLRQLWSLYEDAYRSVEFISPEVVKPYKNANKILYNIKYRVLMGVGIPFRQQEINLEESLAVNRLYLVDKQYTNLYRKKALEILPFFTIDNKDHCYYLERFEKRTALWKTYQVIQEEIPKFEYLNKDLDLIFSHFELY